MSLNDTGGIMVTVSEHEEIVKEIKVFVDAIMQTLQQSLDEALEESNNPPTFTSSGKVD